MTSTVEKVVEYVTGLGRVDAILNNTHLDDETTVEIVQEGAKQVYAAAQELGIPMVATSAVKELADQIGPVDAVGCEVRPLRRLMPKAFW